MNKAVIMAFAVIIALLVAILTIIAFDYWNIPTGPVSSPTPTPKPIDIHDMPGELTITSAAYRVWTGYPQLYVWFNWTGPSFNLHKIRFSVEEHFELLSSGTYPINHSENTIIWKEFPLGDYAPHGQLELRFLDVDDNTIRTAYFPVAQFGSVPYPAPTPTPSPTPAATPTPEPTPTPTPIEVEPTSQLIITSVTTYTPTTHAPVAVTFTWTGAQIYVPRIRLTVGTQTYWHSGMTVNTGENGLSVMPVSPPPSYPSGTQVELAFLDVTGDTPFRTANYTMP